MKNTTLNIAKLISSVTYTGRESSVFSLAVVNNSDIIISGIIIISNIIILVVNLLGLIIIR